MRLLLPFFALPLVLAACGGRTHAVETPNAKAAADPAQALAALADAVHTGDAAELDALLVRPSKPGVTKLRTGALASLGEAKPRTLYRGGDWAVAVVTGKRADGGHAAYAAAMHLVGGRWRADLSGRATVRILGPRPGVRTAGVTQVAAALEAHARLAESGLWIDRTELIEKGGGSPTRGTIYGAPEHPLRGGVHIAVAYARDATHGAAVAWIFRV